jgi:hypothetical protein
MQVMDLVVNGPLKAAIRRARCAQLFVYFLNFKAKCAQELAKPAAERVMPAFAPPKPKLLDGLIALIKANFGSFTTDAFKAGLRKAFVKVGLAPLEDGAFVNYTSHSRATMPTALAPADAPTDDVFVLGDVAGEVEMEARPQGEGEGEEGEEEESDVDNP